MFSCLKHQIELMRYWPGGLIWALMLVGLLAGGALLKGKVPPVITVLMLIGGLLLIAYGVTLALYVIVKQERQAKQASRGALPRLESEIDFEDAYKKLCGHDEGGTNEDDRD